jgi:hypothetical protein
MPNIEKISPYARTTRQRVKGILTMSDSDWDDVLSRYINSVTDFIER